MSKTLYISDLDGTLLNQNAELSVYTKEVLNSMIANGLNFSVATARTASSALVILADVQGSIPIVLMNGVLIYDTTQKQYIQTHPLTAKSALTVITALKELNVTGMMYKLEDSVQHTYYETLDHKPIRDFITERITRYNKKFRQTSSFLNVPPEGIIYFTLLDIYENIRRTYDTLMALPDINCVMYKDNYSPDLWYLEIHSDMASKKNGVDFLREKYGFERIIGFGDNLNDLPMFEACDVRIAVDNAKPEVKNAADFICSANDNDGVAKWLKENTKYHG